MLRLWELRHVTLTLPELAEKIWELLPYSDIPTREHDLQPIMDLMALYGEQRYVAGYEDCMEHETGRRNWGV